MKYINEFRNSRSVMRVSRRIYQIMPEQRVNIMEVCGTHTQSFYRFGLNKLIPAHLNLISGPGCPVCVSSQDYIDRAIQLSRRREVIILTFGDMLRVPGTYTSLQKERAEGGDIRVVYSPWDSLGIARENPDKRVVFLAVGFETTAPAFALTLLAARGQRIKNLSFLCSLKLIPPAMKALVADKQLKIDGFLCPGHVSAIIGTQSYEFIPKRYKIGCCVAGFEPLDILEGIYFLLSQLTRKSFRVDNQYTRTVKREGNPQARRIIRRVFRISDALWRGIGQIPHSGFKLRDEFCTFDIEREVPLDSYAGSGGGVKPKKTGAIRIKRQRQCRCAEVLKGIIQPSECALFRKYCRPDNPYGPCMVSNEGACNAFFRYK